MLLIVGLVLGALFLVCGGAGVGIYFLAIKPAAEKVRAANDRLQAQIAERQKQIEKEQQAMDRVWNLAELNAEVRDKTPAQVRDLLGPPSETKGDVEKGLNARYVYLNRARLGGTGKPVNVEVLFANGVATLAQPQPKQ